MVSAIADVGCASTAWRYKTWLLHSAKSSKKINGRAVSLTLK